VSDGIDEVRYLIAEFLSPIAYKNSVDPAQ
jgi:hypothetical protein